MFRRKRDEFPIETSSVSSQYGEGSEVEMENVQLSVFAFARGWIPNVHLGPKNPLVCDVKVSNTLLIVLQCFNSLF